MIVATRLSAVWQGGAVAAAALICYLVSQSVAAERANVARLDAQIARARGDIAKLTIELDSRARMGQLERWNSEVLSLSAPTPQQFVADGVQLASLFGRRPSLPLNPAITSQAAPQHVAYTPAPEAAAEPAPAPVPVVQPAIATPPRAQPLLHQAAYVQPSEDRLGAPVPAPAAAKPVVARPVAARTAERAAKRPASLLPDDIGALIAAEAKASKGAKAR